MLSELSAAFSIIALLGLFAVANVSAAPLGPSLQSRLYGLAADAKVGTVINSFNTTRGLQPLLKAHVKPNEATRAFKAYALDSFRQRFAAGN